MQTSCEIVKDENTCTKKVWSKPVFEIISRDIIKTSTIHVTHPENTNYSS